MKTMKRLAVGLLCTLCLHGAQAQLYTEDSSFGANTLVVDTRTSLSWLQLSSSTGLTEADWQGAYDNGWTFQSGAYEGYRVATQTEVNGLVDYYVRCTFGPCIFGWSDTGTSDLGVALRAVGLTALMGGEFSVTSDGGLRSLMSGAALWGGYPSYNTAVWTRFNADGAFTSSDHYAPRNGQTFLIAPVPEPSTYALFLVGLGFLVWTQRRRAIGRGD